MKSLALIALLNLALAFPLEHVRAASAPESGGSPAAPGRDYWPTGGWKTAAPEAEGVDTNALARSLGHVARICPTIHSLLVVRHGRLVVERYFNGTHEPDPWNIKSASKSVLSALVGIALERGYIRSLDQPVLDFFPEYPDQLSDPRKKQITLRHLLTMSAGLEWEENGPITFRWLGSRDRVGFTLKSKLVAEPGTRWNYSTALTHLLSAILTKASGTNTLAFAREALLDPIGVTVHRWDLDAQGYYCGGSEVYLTPRDMAKFGYLYLNDGQWEGRQVVPASWVRASTQQTNSARYGFFWWLDTFEGQPIYFAQGLGGQHIVVVPHLDAVVVTTAYLPRHFSTLSFVKLCVLPALRSGEADKEHLPPAQEIIARYYEAVGGREALGKLKSLRIAGTVQAPATGVQEDFEVLKSTGNRFVSSGNWVLGTPGGSLKRVGSDGQLVWTSSGGYRVLTAEEARPWRERAGAWTDLCGPTAGMRTVALVSFADRRCYQLEAVTDEGEVETDFYDAETGLLAGSIRPEVVGSAGVLAFTRLFIDYRKFGELLFPTKVISHVQGPEVVFTRTAVEYIRIDPRTLGLPVAVEDIAKGKRGALR
jgi:CubicO group peptidase (beta-lactamase class C family)